MKKIALIVIIIAIVFCCIAPPWQSIGKMYNSNIKTYTPEGYGFLWNPPSGADVIDYGRFFIQIGLLLFLGICIVFSDRIFPRTIKTMSNDSAKSKRRKWISRVIIPVLIIYSIVVSIAYVFTEQERSKYLSEYSTKLNENLLLSLELHKKTAQLSELKVKDDWRTGLKEAAGLTAENEAEDMRDFKRYHEKTFIVTVVAEGDTIDINIPDGNNLHTRIKLLGVNAPKTESSPEDKMSFGVEAKTFVTKLVLGKPVTVYLEKNNTRDLYKTLLAYIQLEDGSFLNEILLSEGYAYADQQLKHSFSIKYKQLETAARSQKKGLWENVK